MRYQRNREYSESDDSLSDDSDFVKPRRVRDKEIKVNSIIYFIFSSTNSHTADIRVL